MISHDYINSQGLPKRATSLWYVEAREHRVQVGRRNSQSLSTMVSQTVLGWNRAHRRNSRDWLESP